MNEQNLDVNFVKENLNRGDIIGQIGISSLKALFTTVVILGCFAAIMNVGKETAYLQSYIYLSIGVGVFAALLLASVFYYGKITTAFQIIYTHNIDKDENIFALSLRTALAVGIGLAISGVAYFTQSYGWLMLNLTYCCAISTAFLYYIFRHNLNRKTCLIYAGYGIITGIAAYGLGTLVVLAMGLIGFWLTIAILSLEVAFTAFYTYVGLLDWVAQEKQRRESLEKYQAQQREKEEAEKIQKLDGSA